MSMKYVGKVFATAHNTLKNIRSTIEMMQNDAKKHQEEINKILAFVEKVSSLETLDGCGQTMVFCRRTETSLKRH